MVRSGASDYGYMHILFPLPWCQRIFYAIWQNAGLSKILVCLSILFCPIAIAAPRLTFEVSCDIIKKYILLNTNTENYRAILHRNKWQIGFALNKFTPIMASITNLSMMSHLLRSMILSELTTSLTGVRILSPWVKLSQMWILQKRRVRIFLCGSEKITVQMRINPKNVPKLKMQWNRVSPESDPTQLQDMRWRAAELIPCFSYFTGISSG